MSPADRKVAVERLLDDAQRQGLPRYITDPAAIERVAAIVRGAVGSRVTA